MSEPGSLFRPTDDVRGALSVHASELYDDLRLMPMLRKLVRTSCTLADAVGGSISIVDPAAGRYTKVAELGTACRLGQTFPLHEGVTGQVMDRRAPVVLRTYREIATGHLAADHPAWDGAVAGVPIWWRGDIVAVNVIFAGVARPFSVDEVDHLELVTQVVAPGLVTAIDRELPAAPRPQRYGREGGLGVAAQSVTGRGPVGLSVDDVALGLLELADRATADRGREWSPYVHVRVAGQSGRPRLLIGREALRPETGGTLGASAVWHELVDGENGPVAVEQLGDPGGAAGLAWETGDSLGRRREPSPSPFSAREQEVLGLLARGLSDRAVAEELCLSPKTVEKHVSAVLRKTGTTSRTAAVVHCIQQGWLEPSS